LPDKWNPLLSKFHRQRNLINALEKSRSELPMHLDGGANDPTRQVFQLQRHPPALSKNSWVPSLLGS
jgi:hypothetical protein